MKKDVIRDYATDAFCFAAECGYPSYEVYRKKIYNDALSSCCFANPQDSILYAENQMLTKAPEILDVTAVYETFNVFELGEKEHIVKAVKKVYYYPIRKGDIDARVHKFSIDLPASEASVYRWLAQARRLFAVLRGLRSKR